MGGKDIRKKQKRNNAFGTSNNNSNNHNTSHDNNEYGIWRQWTSGESRTSKKHDRRSSAKRTRRISKCGSMAK